MSFKAFRCRTPDLWAGSRASSRSSWQSFFSAVVQHRCASEKKACRVQCQLADHSFKINAREGFLQGFQGCFPLQNYLLTVVLVYCCYLFSRRKSRRWLNGKQPKIRGKIELELELSVLPKEEVEEAQKAEEDREGIPW